MRLGFRHCSTSTFAYFAWPVVCWFISPILPMPRSLWAERPDWYSHCHCRVLTEQLTCAARFKAPLEALEFPRCQMNRLLRSMAMSSDLMIEKLKFSTNLCLCMQSSRCLKKPTCSCYIVLDSRDLWKVVKTRAALGWCGSSLLLW